MELIKAISQPWWKHTKTIVIKSIFFPSCQSRSRRLEFSPPNAPHLLVQPHRRLLLPSPPSPPIAVRCASRLGRPPATCPYLHQGKRVAVRARLLSRLSERSCWFCEEQSLCTVQTSLSLPPRNWNRKRWFVDENVSVGICLHTLLHCWRALAPLKVNYAADAARGGWRRQGERSIEVLDEIFGDYKLFLTCTFAYEPAWERWWCDRCGVRGRGWQWRQAQGFFSLFRSHTPFTRRDAPRTSVGAIEILPLFFISCQDSKLCFR